MRKCINAAPLYPGDHTRTAAGFFCGAICAIAIQDGGILAIEHRVGAHDDGDRHLNTVVARHHDLARHNVYFLNWLHRGCQKQPFKLACAGSINIAAQGLRPTADGNHQLRVIWAAYDIDVAL